MDVREIKGVGEKTQKLLKKMNIETVDQLLHHYPRCYVTYPEPVPIGEINLGNRAVVEAVLASPVRMKSTRYRKTSTALVKDATGSLFLRWFNLPYLSKSLKEGETYLFAGTPVYKEGRWMMDQPEVLTREKYIEKSRTLQPVYPLTAGLSNTTLRKAQKEAFRMVEIGDYLSEEMRDYYQLIPEREALEEIHFPTVTEELVQARKRIIFDEFFHFFQGLALIEDQEEKTLNRHRIPMDERVEAFVENLPFPLTGAQKNTVEDIRKDFLGTAAMNRLVQGDVGSGKTIVAVIAMYAAVLAGCQAVMMAPTEVLSDQHYDSVRNYLAPLGVEVAVLKSAMKASVKREIKERLEQGQIHILIGTHAVIQEDVAFANLGLVITDEQHRFGVRQRDALMKKGEDPHVLVMSATPIPRTLGIILYRNMDVSIMDEMPANRLPIKNSVMGKQYRPHAWRFIEKQIAMGHQAYVICPMIEDSENQDLENVNSYSQMLSSAMPSSVRVASLNGRMSAEEKSRIMDSYAAGDIDILVSTTVIEVGIDVPNATVILIENAERYGLSQLHQLRGRVGRGKDQSYCIFLAGNDSKEAMDRLQVVGRSNDGFAIANEDLKMRGPGDFFGTRQSGTFDFALGDIYANADIMKMASQAVDYLKDHGGLTDTGIRSDLDEKLNFARNI